MKIRKKLGVLAVIISIIYGIISPIFFNFGTKLYLNEELNDIKTLNKLNPKISITYTSSIEINGSAKGIGANNWTWAKDQGYCTGTGSSGSPYLIANNTFNVNGGTALTIVDSHNDYFKIENCTSLNSGDCHIKFDNVSKGLITNSSFTSKNYALDIYNSQNITAFDNTLKNVNNDAIRISQCSDINISDNFLTENSIGIRLSNSINNLIYDNTIYDSIYGIILSDSEFNLISENFLYSNTEGIRLHPGNNNNITLNLIANNDYGIFIWNGEDNEIIKNTVQNNKYIGIRLYQCYEGNNISNNTIFSNDAGIVLEDSHNSIMSYNNITYNGNGISLSGGLPFPCVNNTIIRNTISYSNSSGIGLTLSSENQILENTINYNDIGIDLYLSNFNNVSANFFICNNEHIVEQDSANNIGENYYEDCPPEEDKEIVITGYLPFVYIGIILIGVSFFIIFLKRKKISKN